MGGRVWFALFACDGSDDSDVARDVIAEITAPGPSRVGYRESEVVYTDVGGAGERTLFLATWYPTDATVGAGEVRYHGLVEDTIVLRDAAVALGTFPVAVFSHGHQGYAENSSYLMRHLASHDWVVLAPDHTGNTTFDDSDRADAIYYQRPADITAVLDHVYAGGEPFSGQLDDAVVGFGHSFGGYTIFANGGATYAGERFAGVVPFSGGLADDRILGVVPMAAGDFDLFGATGVATVDVPVLMLTAELDSDDAEPYWSAVQGGSARRVVLLGGGHQSFIDLSMIEEVPLPAEEGWRIVNAYGLAFAEHLRGDAEMAPVLDGSLTVSTEATVLP